MREAEDAKYSGGNELQCQHAERLVYVIAKPDTHVRNPFGDLVEITNEAANYELGLRRSPLARTVRRTTWMNAYIRTSHW